MKFSLQLHWGSGRGVGGEGPMVAFGEENDAGTFDELECCDGVVGFMEMARPIAAGSEVLGEFASRALVTDCIRLSRDKSSASFWRFSEVLVSMGTAPLD